MVVVIGLTGNIACGKSEVGKIFSKHGIPVLDSDQLVHEIYQNDGKVQEALEQEFGTLDRKQIAAQVFGDGIEHQARRKTLESIVHPVVDTRFREWVRSNIKKRFVVNLVPLLFEAKLESRYDYIITVKTQPELQIERLHKRNPELSETDIKHRIASQMPQEEKASRSDFVLENNGNLDDLELEIEEILDRL